MNDSIRVDEHLIPNQFVIIPKDDGFLVDEGMGTELAEVTNFQGHLRCDCFIFQISSDSDCEHIRAVKQYSRQGRNTMVLSQAEADIYLSRIAKIDAELDTDNKSGAEQIERIQLWLELRRQRLEGNRSYYTFQLQAWMEANKHKSKQLVNGLLKLRNQPFQITVIDETELMKDERFKRIIPEKYEVDKKALRKYVTDTGEILPGIEVKTVPPKFSYQLSTGGSK